MSVDINKYTTTHFDYNLTINKNVNPKLLMSYIRWAVFFNDLTLLNHIKSTLAKNSQMQKEAKDDKLFGFNLVQLKNLSGSFLYEDSNTIIGDIIYSLGFDKTPPKGFTQTKSEFDDMLETGGLADSAKNISGSVTGAQVETEGLADSAKKMSGSVTGAHVETEGLADSAKKMSGSVTGTRAEVDTSAIYLDQLVTVCENVQEEDDTQIDEDSGSQTEARGIYNYEIGSDDEDEVASFFSKNDRGDDTSSEGTSDGTSDGTSEGTSSESEGENDSDYGASDKEEDDNNSVNDDGDESDSDVSIILEGLSEKQLEKLAKKYGCDDDDDEVQTSGMVNENMMSMQEVETAAA